MKNDQGSKSVQLAFPKWFKEFLTAYKQLNPDQMHEYMGNIHEYVGDAIEEILQHEDSKYFFNVLLENSSIKDLDGTVFYEGLNVNFEQIHDFHVLLVNTSFKLRTKLRENKVFDYMSYFKYSIHDVIEEMTDFDKAVLGGEENVVEEMNFKEGLKIIFDDDYDYIVRNGKKFKLN